MAHQITKTSVKAIIMLIALALFVSAPFMIANVTPDYVRALAASPRPADKQV